MFRALLCLSSGARECHVVYHIGRFVLGFHKGREFHFLSIIVFSRKEKNFYNEILRT